MSSLEDKRTQLVKQLSKKEKTTLAQSKGWYAYTTPPRNTLKGTVVPRIISYRRRRICVETHRFSNDTEKTGDDTSGYYETCFLLIMDPIKNHRFHKDSVENVEDKEYARPMEAAPDDRSVYSTGSDDGTLSDAFSGMDSGIDTVFGKTKTSYDGWSVRYQFPLQAVSIQKIKGTSVTFKVDHRDVNHLRKVKFETTDETEECVKYIRELKSTEEARLDAKYAECMKRLSGHVTVNAKENVCLLVEIVGATDLPCGDLKSSDPYVKCYYDGMIVHKTGYLKKNLNPIFTLKQKNLFLLDTTAETLFKSDGLNFNIMDYDGIGKHESLGTCNISPDLMYLSNGERLPLEVECDRKVHKKTPDEDETILAVRIRHATDNDKEFMKNFIESRKASKKHHVITPPALHNQGGKLAIQSYMTRNEKIEKVGMGSPVTKYRVRPSADPERPEETEWLSKSDLRSEMMKESREWIDSGSGGIGRLFVEVLEAKDLPNLDSGGFAGNKTDSFCCLVFEDNWVQTDIIDDCLFPKWMPWSKRAFIFNAAHPCSELFVGVFDYDKMDEHDLIGRIAVDVANLQPDTVYDLSYNLYPTGKTDSRDGLGKLRLRIRLEIDDDRNYLMSALQPPNILYVNVPSKKKYKVIDKVLNGDVDMQSYSLKTIFMYIDELQSYQAVLNYLQSAIIIVIFWRGHHPLKFLGTTFLLPVHSLVTFLACILAVEYPQVIPSLSFLFVSWVMFATMWFRQHHPNKWNRCKPFKDMLTCLITGENFTPGKIEPFENSEAINKYDEEQKRSMERSKKLAEEAEEDAKQAAQEDAEFALEVGGSNDISTKKGPGLLDVDMLRPYLEPYQTYLAIACRFLRYIGNILLWQECYLSFWVLLGSLALSVGCFFVPWMFLIRWTSRIVAWTLFGPWMKLVDIYYWKPMEMMSDEERMKKKLEAQRVRKVIMKKQIEEARIAREKAVKTKDMKTHMFGKYILKVPALKEDRWWDVPLPESSAVPHKPEKLALAELAMKEAGYHTTRIPGQNLEGDMIPTIRKYNFTEAPMGQATKKHAESESDTAAYTKVGSLVAGAAIITYFGVPILASVGSNVFGS